MSKPLLSPQITSDERPYLCRLGARLREVREEVGLSRAAVADRTGLNLKTLYRIEIGARRTRQRTLSVIAEVLVDQPGDLVHELMRLGGPAIAHESSWAERIETRRLKRLRRIQVLEAREVYAAERAALEARWPERTATHLQFRAAMRTVDMAFRVLRRLGEL